MFCLKEEDKHPLHTMPYIWAFVQVTKCGEKPFQKGSCEGVSFVPMIYLFFSVWFSFTDTDNFHVAVEERRSQGATNIQTLFATLRLKWLPHIFNLSACNYQTVINLCTSVVFR